MKSLLYFMLGFAIFGGLTLSCSEAQAQLAGASAGANAAQGQDQVQAQTNTLSNVGNSAVLFENSFNGEAIRGTPLPSAVEVTTRGGPAMFGRPDYENPGPNFMSMNNLVSALNAIDLDKVAPNDESDIEMIAQAFAVATADDVAKSRKAGSRIKFMLNSDVDVTRTVAAMNGGASFQPLAVVTLKADDNDTMNSASLAIKLAKYARSIGADKIVLVQEGVVKRLSSWGIGLGLSYNYASVGSDASDHGSVGAGGTGWSMGEGEYFSLPYLTAVVGR